MKLKTLLATATVAAIASSAVMAEGGYVGVEMNNNSVSAGQIKLNIIETQTFYAGVETELTDTLTLDTRFNMVSTDLYDADLFSYSAKLTQEIDNFELYGGIAYVDGDYGIRGTEVTLGARYNFN